MRYLFLLLLPCLCTCDRAPDSEVAATLAPLQRLQGEAMGSYYRVTYLGDSIPSLQLRIDSLLAAYNQELSAWEPTSKLNEFNASTEGISLSGTDHFLPNLELAKQVSQETDGAYDPTVAPLVRYWGFGTGKRRETADFDRAEVKAIRQLVGLDRIELEGEFLRKQPGTELDLNASAKGYGVDLISRLLTEAGRPDHLIDIGGEMRGGGTKNGKPWNVAIRLPDEDKTKIAQAGTLPLADGYATACLVVGPEEALKLMQARPDLDGYFLVRAENGELKTVKSW